VFGDGPNFLLGWNGTGKTTLLELIGAVLRMDFAVLRGESPLDVEWTIGLESAGNLELRFCAEPGESGSWALTGEFRGDGKSYSFAYDSREGERLDGRERRDLGPAPDVFGHSFAGLLGFRLLEAREELGTSAQPPVTLAFAQLSLARCHRLDEATEAFDVLVGEGRKPPPRFAIGSGGRGTSASDLPVDIALFLMPLLNGPSPRLSVMQALGPLQVRLAPLVGLLRATDVTLAPRLIERRPENQATFEGFDVFVTWPDGSEHRHTQLSFGQKRLFAFFWNLSFPGPVLADELTNGLHAVWVQACLDALAGRQSFHAVQNPLLVDFAGPGSAEEIRGRFCLCTVAMESGRRVWRWRNPTAAEAARLRAAWDAGIQPLHEILHDQGLW
jgi:hypothetical protein